MKHNPLMATWKIRFPSSYARPRLAGSVAVNGLVTLIRQQAARKSFIGRSSHSGYPTIPRSSTYMVTLPRLKKRNLDSTGIQSNVPLSWIDKTDGRLIDSLRICTTSWRLYTGRGSPQYSIPYLKTLRLCADRWLRSPVRSMNYLSRQHSRTSRVHFLQLLNRSRHPLLFQSTGAQRNQKARVVVAGIRSFFGVSCDDPTT